MMKNKIHVACVIGTRPEVIKMAPIIKELRKYPQYHIFVINTAQHRELLDDMLTIFQIAPDIDMNIMQNNQSLAELSGQLFLRLNSVMGSRKFDVVLAQGDTTTTWVAAQIAFYNNIKFGHVEAGLRSGDFRQPFPEEMNRVFVSKLATWHFAPTATEKQYLLNENVPEENIFVTGNTVIDSLYTIAKRNVALPFSLPKDKRIILVTLHRRESFGDSLRNIFQALIDIVNTLPDVHIVYPVHPNPHVHDTAYEILGNHDSIQLLSPLRYDAFVTLMQSAYLIMSDSGGIQEEAPALAKPVIILREKTERPLIVELGLGVLAGTHKQDILHHATEILTNPEKYKAMQKHISPYGDGLAAERIVKVIAEHFIKEVV